MDTPKPTGDGQAAFVAQCTEWVDTAILLAPHVLSLQHWDRHEQGALYAPLTRVEWALLLRRTFGSEVRNRRRPPAPPAKCLHLSFSLRACRELIDRIKERVPVWKREIGPDGTSWVGWEDARCEHHHEPDTQCAKRLT